MLPCHHKALRAVHTQSKYISEEWSQGWVEMFVIWLINIYGIVSNLKGARLVFRAN